MNNLINLQEIVNLQSAFWNQMSEDKLILNGVSAFVTLIKDPFLNLALYNGFTSEITPKDIDKVINQVNNFFATHNIVWTWCLNSIPGADLLAEGLKRNNYIFLEESPNMLFNFSNETLDTDGVIIPKLHIAEVDTPAKLKEWFQPIIDGFDVPLGNEDYLELNQRIPYGFNNNFHHYVGFYNGEPVTSGTLYVHNNGSMLHNLATKNQYRRKGFGSALIVHILNEARKYGCLYCDLDASEDGQKLYRSLGFETIFHNVTYKKEFRSE